MRNAVLLTRYFPDWITQEITMLVLNAEETARALGWPELIGALDLHVLSLPPAFVLSQDQTLKLRIQS